MRFFLFTYGSRENFQISRNRGVFGCKDARDGLGTKFKRLKEGDVVVIRNSESNGHNLCFFGHCVVTSTPYDHRCAEEPPFEDYLWADEQHQQKLIYPFRVKVDFENPPHLTRLHAITWKNLLSLQWKNKKGNVMGKLGLPKFLGGNFLSGEQAETFADLVGFREPTPENDNAVGLEQSLLEIGKAGERVIYHRLRQRYPSPLYEVIWVAQQDPTSPYDLEVRKRAETILYVEVKATTRSSSSPGAFISARELNWRNTHKKKHKLYFVEFFDRSSLDKPKQVRVLHDEDFTLAVCRRTIRFPISSGFSGQNRARYPGLWPNNRLKEVVFMAKLTSPTHC